MAMVIFSGMAMFHVSSNLDFHSEILLAQNFDTRVIKINCIELSITKSTKKSLVFVS